MKSLKLGQYKELFMSEGYCTNEDVENLKGLTSAELQSIGITRRGTYNQVFKLVNYFCSITDNIFHSICSTSSPAVDRTAIPTVS